MRDIVYIFLILLGLVLILGTGSCLLWSLLYGKVYIFDYLPPILVMVSTYFLCINKSRKTKRIIIASVAIVFIAITIFPILYLWMFY